MTITSVNQTDEFLLFLNTTIDTDDYRYKYLTQILDLAFGHGQAEVTENTAIYQAGEDWIIYIETVGQLFLYGNNNDELLTELSNRINLNQFPGYEIMGEFNIVYGLLKKQNINNYSIIKDRLFYQLKQTGQLLPKLENTLPEIEDVEELTHMMLAYYHEEYNGTRDKEYEQIYASIQGSILADKIHVFKEENIIKAFCTVGNPDIGIIFTKPEFRNNKIGKRLLSTCSSLLFDLNDTCYLMTDLNNQSSNKMTKDIGYEEIYKHSNIQI